ncbi:MULTISPECIES: DNA polymerase III subunit epsilon [Novosphingobium]|uniref:DNA polymerase III subunit epsilon n=2 Tax=Novosphingobium TaxID=165696 RepID=A0ABT0AB20_9SPHN|nr:MULTISPECIES: DNA polymerase III subunit epsilon [Novosphingobium]MCJ1960382.1 DNA polymerase III subunit epsilon [Novosphingobium mangrovi (ex Hu et al. 2023)]QVM84462.1 DNA polymerase III subunit epsilon [Novosphingobium decolorationis]
MREIIFDTETTGFDPKNGDRMVEIGCVEMINRVETGNSYHAYFNPQRSMPAEAEAVHGLSEAFLADKPLFAECAQEFLDFVQDSPMVAHNATFDFNFINAELAMAGHRAIDLDRMVDTIVLAKAKHPGAKLSLDALCSRYGIDRSHRTKHGALLDAELLAQVYVELRGGRQIGLELVAQTTEIVSETKVLTRKDRPFRQPRPHAATDEELSAHAEFLKSVDTPLWGA